MFPASVRGRVKNAPAQRAADQFISGGVKGGLCGHFHVAPAADAVMHRHHGLLLFAGKEPFVVFEQIGLDPGGELLTGLAEFLETQVDLIFPFLEEGEALFFLGNGLFGGGLGLEELGLKAVGLLHEEELFFLKPADVLPGALDFVGEGGVFLIFASFHLLALVAGDELALGTLLAFEGFAFELEGFEFLPELLKVP